MITPHRPGLDGLQADGQDLTQPGHTVAGLVEAAGALAHTAVDKTRQQTGRWLDAGATRIGERPLQAFLVAAATGAVLMLLMQRLVRGAGPSR